VLFDMSQGVATWQSISVLPEQQCVYCLEGCPASLLPHSRSTVCH